jgi:hypothetical protein
VLALLIAPGRLVAQAELQGRVLAETARRPIANATVAVLTLGLRTVTDSLGRFRLSTIPRGEHVVVTSALGFRPDSTRTAFDGDETLVSDVVLKPAVNELPTVAVRAPAPPARLDKMAAFEERKALGIGHFIDSEELEKEKHRMLGDILASRVPGVTVHHGGFSKSWVASSRTTSVGKCAMCRVSKTEVLTLADIAAGARLACYLDVYVDGTAVYSSSSTQVPLFDVNEMQTNEIEGVEVYTGLGQIPARYNKTSGGCGVMLIWLRDGPRNINRDAKR